MQNEGTRPIGGVGSNARRATEVDDLELASADGVAIHALIAAIAERHGADASPDQVLEFARRLGSRKLAPVYRQSARQRVTTAAAFYFRRFAPSGWSFVGSETVIRDVALDLLWERRGSFMADELKSGLTAGTLEKGRVAAQVSAQVAAGRDEWGDGFVGVRAILLSTPEESFFEAA